MLKYGLNINGHAIGGLLEGVDTALETFPEIEIPRDLYRRDEYWVDFSRQTRYVKETERATGRMTLIINTKQPTHIKLRKGRTEFEKKVILPLNTQAIIPVELEETSGIIYYCRLASNIQKQNLAGKTRTYAYQVELSIEWMERRVFDDKPLVFERYAVDPSKKYYIKYKTNRNKDSFGYNTYRNGTSTGVTHQIHQLLPGTPDYMLNTVEINTLTQVMTEGSNLLGIFMEPAKLITGADEINVFAFNSGGLVTLREVL